MVATAAVANCAPNSDIARYRCNLRQILALVYKFTYRAHSFQACLVISVSLWDEFGADMKKEWGSKSPDCLQENGGVNVISLCMQFLAVSIPSPVKKCLPQTAQGWSLR